MPENILVSSPSSLWEIYTVCSKFHEHLFPSKRTPLTKICLRKFSFLIDNIVYRRQNLKIRETSEASYSNLPPSAGLILSTPLCEID